MKKLLPFLLLLCPLSIFAQEVISTEDQPLTLAFILTAGFGIQVDYNVRNVAVTYTTTDAFGQPDTATGLVCIPDAISPTVFPMAVYNHATTDSRFAVPSVQGVQERFVAQAISAFGFITVAPDYLGLGGSDGFHPYLHAATEASAGRDMIIAVRAWLEEQEIAYNSQVFVTGYSQGGHASMALHRLLESSEETPNVTAAAHLSGGYIMAPPSPQSLAISEPDSRTLRFVLNQIIAYEFVYNLYGGIDNLFVEPYLSEVQSYVAEEINLERLGVVVDSLVRANGAMIGEIFVEQYVTDILDQDTDLFNAYTENTVLDWAPTSPTLLVSCSEDEVVSPLNAVIARDTMIALGSTSVDTLDAGAFNHFDCVPSAVLAAIDFFLQFADSYPTSLGTPVNRPDIRVAPNPVSAGGELLVSGISTARDFIVYDQSGRQLMQGVTSENGRITIPSSLANGLIVIRVSLDDGTSVVRKVVVR